MNLTLINQTKQRMPKAFMVRWLQKVYRKLKLSSGQSLTVVLVGAAASRRLNHQFRRKDRPTDVLSFESTEKGALGELILCMPLVRRQAREHGLSVEEELGYLMLHGVLHLLGYNHEHGGAEARRMYRLQDRLFEDLCRLERGAKRKKTGEVKNAHRHRIIRSTSKS